jgi:cell division protein FtsX
MAAVGAAIVFLGLVVLSFAISQIHKVLDFWEERSARQAQIKTQARSEDQQKAEKSAPKEHHMPKADELVNTYKPLVEQLDEPFELTRLFEIAKENDLPHPHLSINSLREANILVAQEDGTFIWKE